MFYAGLLALGFILMFVAHFVAFIGPDTRLDGGWLPYWWSYLLLYPITTFLITLFGSRRWLPNAIALCATPVLYFLALGMFEGNWSSSNEAWSGALIAMTLSMLLARAAVQVRRFQNNARWTSSGSE